MSDVKQTPSVVVKQINSIIKNFPLGVREPSFWRSYKENFGFVPSAESLVLKDLSDIFNLCQCTVEVRNGVKFILPSKKVEEKRDTVNTKEKGKVKENPKERRKEENRQEKKESGAEGSVSQKAAMPHDREHPYYGHHNPYGHAQPYSPAPPGVPQNHRPPSQVRHQHPYPPFQQYSQPPRQRQRFSRDQLNNTAEDCISRLAASKKLVASSEIERSILQAHECLQVRELGLRSIDELPVVREHLRTQTKVSSYIQGFVKVRAICTLHELDQGLREYMCESQSFESLKLGPLAQQPVVYEFFKFPQDAEIPQLSTADVLEHLRDFLTATDSWQKRDNKIDEFLDFINKKMKLLSPFYLGLRICSLPLAIGILKRSQRDCGQGLRNALQVMKTSTENELTRAYKNLTSSVVVTEPGLTQVQAQYFQMPFEKVLEEFMQKALTLCRTVSHLAKLCDLGKGPCRELNRQTNALEQFLSALACSKTLEILFSIALCCSKSNIQAQIKDLLEAVEIKLPAESEEGDQSVREKEADQKPSTGAIVNELTVFLNRCLNASSLTLTHLSQIERKLLEHFNFKHFDLMCGSSFLAFLLGNKDVTKLLNESGGLGVGQFSAKKSASVYSPSLSDLHAFIQQCQASDQPEMIEAAICAHFGCKDVAELNHGSLQHLMRNQQPRSAHSTSCVVYEAALMAKSSLFKGPKAIVGRLGQRSKSEALSCLQNCPLLEDMQKWSLWSDVFEAECGPIKDFLFKYGGTNIFPVTDRGKNVQLMTNFTALEVEPGRFLRLTSETSPEKFLAAVESLNARDAAGHLASLIVVNCGVEHTPLALLGNHVKNTLFTCTSGKESKDTVVEFVLNCLNILPFNMTQSTANKVFLEPLNHVVGQTLSKELLLKFAGDDSNIHRLGILLGISEWTKKFSERFQLPEKCVKPPQKMDFGRGPEIVLETADFESESEEENELDVLEEIDELLETPLTSDPKVQVTSTPAEEDPPLLKESKLAEIKQTDTDSRPQAVIDRIRQKEFGIGLQMTDEIQELFDKNQARLGRSLQRLAHDLYNKDTHFVLELIQNADDNSYEEKMLRPDAREQPTITFHVTSDAVVMTNNEKGFTARDVAAICDVGCSTKPKHTLGYIGQKGIGFKSVFRVSDEPEILSNGFHFKFDKNSSDMGYILPHWVEGETDHCQGTKIILPFKPDEGSINRSRFNDLHPNLLLFLNRLKKMTLTIDASSDSLAIQQTITRRDIGENVVELCHQETVDRWLVVKKRLNASSLMSKSEQVEATEVGLAFPIQSKQQLNSKELPEKQLLFAFLPLRSYGFRFIVQGDFDLPSSREDVDHDSAWNQWLRSQIPALFIDALQSFKDHVDGDVIEGVCRFLQFIPMEDEVLDFFRPLASSILNLLKRTPCLPAAPLKHDAELKWLLPSQLAAVRDPLLHAIISPQMLFETLGLHFLHADLLPFISPSLCTSLGIQSFSIHQVMDIGRGLVSLINFRDEDIRTVALWMASVYKIIDDFNVDEQILNELKGLKIIPTLRQDFIKLSDSNVFFPVSESADKSPYVMLIEQSLCTIHPKLLSSVADDVVVHSHVQRLLELLQVKKQTAADLIHHHIMSLFKNHEEASEELLVAGLIYIMEQCERDPNIILLADLKESVILRTNHGMLSPSVNPVHFSSTYKVSPQMPDLASELPGYDWTILDSCYLQSSCRSAFRHEFFTDLGVSQFLCVQKVVRKLTKEEMADSIWSPIAPILPPSDLYIINDWACVALEKLLAVKNFQQNTTLFLRLQQYWQNYSQFTLTEIRNSSDALLKSGAITTFSSILKRSPWLPAVDDSDHLLLQPQSVFIPSQDILQLYSKHVPYMRSVTTPSPFTQFLGLKSSVDAHELGDMLKQWAARLPSAPGAPAAFTTSLQHIHNVYAFLHQNLLPKDFCALFTSHPVIFTCRLTDDLAEEVQGQFLSSSEVRWDDPTRLFRKHMNVIPISKRAEVCRFTLCVIYRGMEQLFQSINVQSVPTFNDLMTLLFHVTESHRQQEVLKDVFMLYGTISSAVLAFPDHEKPAFIQAVAEALSAHSCIPTVANTFVSLRDRPMISDSPTHQAMLKVNGVYPKGVHFIETEAHFAGKPLGASINELMLLLKVPLLSSSISSETVSMMSSPDIQLHNYVIGVIEGIRRVLFHFHHEIYEMWRKSAITDTLKTLQFSQVESLEIVYRLKHLPNMDPIIHKQDCCLSEDGFWILKSEAADKSRAPLKINRALAAFFSKGKSAAMKDIKALLNELLVIDPSRDFDDFYDDQDLPPLPSVEAAWTIPPPRFIPPPPPPAPLMQATKMSNQPTASEPQTNAASGTSSWPPKSSSMTVMKANTGTGPAQKWPPPAPPENFKATVPPPPSAPNASSSLPQNHSHSNASSMTPGEAERPSRPPSTQHPGNLSDATHSQTHGHGVHGDGGGTAAISHDENGATGQQGDRPSVSTSISNEKRGIAGRPHKRSSSPLPQQDDSKRRHHIQHDFSSVLVETSEGVYTDLNFNFDSVDVALGDDSNNKEIALYGELLVKKHLEEEMRKENSDIVSVEWTSETDNPLAPYDFRIQFQTAKGLRQVFIEVKTTKMNDKAFCEISLPELNFALEKRNNFHLYRVFNAGNIDKVRLCKVENIAEKIEQKVIKICLLV